MDDYEKLWNEFWLPMLKDNDGNLNLNQLAKELYDYFHVLHNVKNVYATITGGEISNPATAPEFVIAYADAYYAGYYGIDLELDSPQESAQENGTAVDSFFTSTYNSGTLH
jgi:hypothetical protein